MYLHFKIYNTKYLHYKIYNTKHLHVCICISISFDALTMLTKTKLKLTLWSIFGTHCRHHTCICSPRSYPVLYFTYIFVTNTMYLSPRSYL